MDEDLKVRLLRRHDGAAHDHDLDQDVLLLYLLPRGHLHDRGRDRVHDRIVEGASAPVLVLAVALAPYHHPLVLALVPVLVRLHDPRRAHAHGLRIADINGIEGVAVVAAAALAVVVEAAIVVGISTRRIDAGIRKIKRIRRAKRIRKTRRIKGTRRTSQRRRIKGTRRIPPPLLPRNLCMANGVPTVPSTKETFPQRTTSSWLG